MAIEDEQDQAAEAEVPAEIVAAQERFQQAVEAFLGLNRSLREGEEPFALPAMAALEQGATLDLVLTILSAHGLLDEQAFIEARILRMAEIVEALTTSGREMKRQRSGLILANAFGRPPT